jgi:hypothetical protein
MYTALLADGRLRKVLQRCDDDLAAECRAGGCPRCHGVLHSARYPRKPRGCREQLSPEYGWRSSFCCAERDCRQRATPPSLRFLGRKVYLGAVVVLIAALRCGPTPARMRYLEELVGVSRRTVGRWRRWWCEELPATPFWRAASGTLLPPVQRSELPAALLERFTGSAQERWLGLLRFILPITTGSAMAQVI